MFLYKNILARRNLKRIPAICCKVWDELLIAFNYEDAKKQMLVKFKRKYDEFLSRAQAVSAVLHHNYTNFGMFSRKGALQSGVVYELNRRIGVVGTPNPNCKNAAAML